MRRIKTVVLTPHKAAIECVKVPPSEGGTFISPLRQPAQISSAATTPRYRSGARLRRNLCTALKAGHPVTSHLLPTFARVDLAFERGEGAWLTATNGERYLDFTGGVAVNALGHAHPKLVEALTAQAHKVWHVSNLFRIPEGERLAAQLCEAAHGHVLFLYTS